MAFYVFGLVLLPTLAFLGLATFERAIQASIEDLAAAQQINRVRQFYLESSPALAAYLAPTGEDTPAATMQRMGVTNLGWQRFVATAGAIGVINSVLIGRAFGLLADLIAQIIGVSILVGVLGGAIALWLQLRRQRTLWHRAEVGLLASLRPSTES